MVKTLTLEDRKRRSRNILFSAFILLIVIWTVKLAFPQQTLISAYQNHQAGLSSLQPVATASSTGAASAPTGTAVNGEEKPKAVADMFSESIKPFNGSLTTKAAVIIETRFRTNLVPLILHFGSVLGPTWPILIYTSAEAVGQFSTSAALARYLKTGIIQVRILPQTTLFTNSDSVNAFMTQKWIWEDLAPAEHILIFQSDSMLCANAARSVEDYFHYDLVGAPIAKDLGKGYNGGLSLRKRSTILRILDTWDWEKTKKDGDRFEDQWFYNRMKTLQEEDAREGRSPEDEDGVNLPAMEIARTFSVETIDYPHPLGVHQVHRWLKDQILSLDTWCPEYKLCSEDHVSDT